MGAVENRYQRSQIQNAAHRYEQQIYDGTRPIIALNKYRNGEEEMPEVELVRTPARETTAASRSPEEIQSEERPQSRAALDKLAAVAETNENCFPALMEAAEVCSLGQISGRLQEVVGRFRPMV